MRKNAWCLWAGTAMLVGTSCSRETQGTSDDGGDQHGISGSSDGGIEGGNGGDDDPLAPPPGGVTSDTSNPETNGDCASVEVDVERTTPTLVLLVDQSGSMTTNFQGAQRWDAVYDTLMAPGTGVVAQLQGAVRFGLTLYSSVDGSAGGECPMLATVAPAFNNLEAIDRTYSAADPIDETPTGESLAVVAQQLAAFDEPGPKAIVLATDGEPDTCAVPNPQMGQPESLAAVEAAFGMGIRTFVISVGNEVGEAHLQELANVGIGRDPNSTDEAPYYQALNAEELIRAFDEIVGGFLLCEFGIDGDVDPTRVCDGAVSFDGDRLECGTDFEVNGRVLRLRGEACEALGDGSQHTVEAEWPCGAITPIP